MKPDNSKILIVDDEKPLRLGLVKIVEAAGYEAFEAEDGNEALDKVKEHNPDLLILDVMMKDMSGLEVCRILKSNRDTCDIKIVMLSARGQTREKEEGINAGADRYITKPFDYKELLKTIKTLLET